MSVFKTKSKERTPGPPVAYIFDKPVKAGEVGLEIEVEGNKFLKEGVPPPWKYHKDGSLRGLDNAEYVLANPIKFEAVPNALKILWDMFEKYGSVLDVSNRTSVHVHLNMQKFHLNRLTAFLALYFSVEELLTEWCGDHRVGNLFCLRAKDATAIITHLKKFIQNDGRYELREGLHYSGLNAHALYKFGSIEIRTLRGCTDPKTIEDWVGILEHMYKLSAEFPDPRSLPSKLSEEGPMAYLELVLGDRKSTILNNINYTISQIRTSLYEGIRLAQDLCYCRDWSLYDPIEVKPDPFGRKIRAKLTQPGQMSPALQEAYANNLAVAQAAVGQGVTPSPSFVPNDWAIINDGPMTPDDVPSIDQLDMNEEDEDD